MSGRITEVLGESILDGVRLTNVLCDHRPAWILSEIASLLEIDARLAIEHLAHKWRDICPENAVICIDREAALAAKMPVAEGRGLIVLVRMSAIAEIVSLRDTPIASSLCARLDFIAANLKIEPSKPRADESILSPGGARPPRKRPNFIVLVDGNNYVHRLFHGRPLSRDQHGPNNAVRGWESAIRRLQAMHRPDLVIAIFDGSGKNWRSDIFPEYKAQRKPTPPDLLVQWPRIYEECDRLGIKRFLDDKHEADDVIASYTTRATDAGISVIIASNDKDLLQLVKDEPAQVRRLNSNDSLDGPDFVVKKYGVSPNRLREILALAGDSTDGIPGAPGVGPKIAQKLISENASIEDVFRRARLLSDAASRSISANEAKIRIYLELVSLRCNLELPELF